MSSAAGIESGCDDHAVINAQLMEFGQPQTKLMNQFGERHHLKQFPDRREKAMRFGSCHADLATGDIGDFVKHLNARCATGL
jgi:hypothetical protein